MAKITPPLAERKPAVITAQDVIETDPERIKWLDEMVIGYGDGRDPDSPDPSENRSHSYRHGFLNGRDDRARRPRASAAVLRVLAENAINDDIEASRNTLR